MTTSVETANSSSNSPLASYEDWRKTVEQELKGAPIEKRLVTRTPEGIDVQPLYRSGDATGSPTQALSRRAAKRAGASGWSWDVDPGVTTVEFSPLPALAVAVSAGRTSVAESGDPLGWLLTHGSIPMPLPTCFDDLAAGVAEADRLNLSGRTIGVGCELWHEAGANAVQELAFALATGAEYWRQLKDRGVAPDRIAARTRVGFAIGVDFYMEVAKLRAARALWAKLAAAFGATGESCQPYLAARTANWDKTVYDQHVNLLRITTEAFSAVVGGADALDIRCFDEVTGKPTELGERMSRNLHQLLAKEFCCEHQVDPAGGAWYVESLTDQLCRKAWALFQEIEKQGGMAQAVVAGYPQGLLAKSAADKRASLDTRRRPILGVTLQPNLREEARPAPANGTAPGRKKSVPKPIKSFAALVAAAKKRTTLPTLRIAWTQKRDSGPSATALQSFRAASEFESLRRVGDDFLARTGRRARVFLAKMGPPKQHKPRADFATGFLAIGGFEMDGKKTFATAEEAADAAVASGAAIAVLCSTDETYPELAPAFVRRIKSAKPGLLVLLAGHPAEREAEFRAAGFDEFIHIRSNLRSTLAQLQRQAGLLS
jgi:methylmalonyl-CoA mutase